MATSTSQQIKISDLTIQQTADLKQTLDEELQFLQQQYEALQSGKQRFEASRKTMQELHDSVGEKPEMLVPMTQSVYQPGKLLSKDRFVVELGAGYYVEREYAPNNKYLEKRLANINSKLEQVSKNIAEKKKISELITLNLQSKVAALQEQMGQNEQR
eukprot:Gregarina_sp_Pseudo_9__979@NODE_162_length_3907_cov_15_700879_g149_i0_p4_GENE_NODE_162_length_3907_cov_15_700879_g149_i0NODE_162_length_3907_cov_15_700879_g149_i0_p4_ORF_typecomplete_len158_score16_55Prefoldin/PF02996_17/1_2e22Filament/PF00038_21/0_012Corona_S2/PF01601_16/4_1e02Corona_S2/PF01601_16/0_0099Spc7/PF08317_11/0_017Spc7/PF08317_11/2_9Prefoldin_2/PF01920_20/0_34AcylCoA_dehyd_C/PF12186_8/82AcylCoA_dehyd_C/PF12186_8/0_12HlyE/PF06109_13/0_087Serpin/PF00079_20/0_044ZapB/PF06005_12/0_035ZapB